MASKLKRTELALKVPELSAWELISHG